MRRKWLSAVFIAALLMATMLSGCQSFQGVDLNKMMLADFEMESYEGKGSLTLDIEFDPEGASDPDAAEMLALFAQSALYYHEMKKESDREFSVKGAFEYANGEIPFEVYINANGQIVFDTEGAKKPVVLDMHGDMPEEMQEEMQAIQEIMPEIQRIILSFLVQNLPNPEHLELTRETVEINGTKINARKIHTEISADEVPELVHQFVHNMKEDRDGLKKTLSDLYDVVMPVVQKFSENASAPGPLMVFQAMQEKDEFIQMSMDLIVPFLEEMDRKMEGDLASGDLTMDDIFHASSKLTVDIYVDSRTHPRKTDVELLLLPPTGQDDFMKSIRLGISQEIWDVNRPVTADEIEVGNDPFIFEPDADAEAFLGNLEEDSPLYKLLKNDLHITRKTLELVLDEGADAENSQKPYISNGYTLVPARYVVENLDAEISWDQESKQVTIYDERTDTEIVLSIDSEIAYVNGREVKLETKTEMKDGTTFVPLRFIVESLQGEVQWNPDTRTITIIVE